MAQKARPLAYDQEKVTMLRMEVIECCLKVLSEKKEVNRWSKYKKELVLKMSARVLPQLNAGREDKEPLFPYARSKEEQAAIDKALSDLNG